MCDMCCWQTHSDYRDWMQSTTCSDTHPLPHSSTTTTYCITALVCRGAAVALYGAIKLSGSSGTDETACRFDLLWITGGYVFCVLGRASSVAGSAPPWSCRFPRLQHQRAKSCLKSTKGVGLKLSRSSAGWPHMWLIESKPCIILSSWWRSGVLTQLIHWKCFCLPAWPSRRPSSPRCLLSSPAGSSSSLWMCVVGVTIAAYQRLVWHAAPPTSLRCLRAYITMATGDDC